MTLRGLRFEDILSVERLDAACFPDYGRWSFSLYAELIENPNFCSVVAEDGGEIMGFGGVSLNGESAVIDKIMVAEEYRRSRFGGEILSRLTFLARERGAKSISLEVGVSNTAAILLYLRSGFCGEEAIKNYYENGEDALKMVKKL